jgi:hypothetical protein
LNSQGCSVGVEDERESRVLDKVKPEHVLIKATRAARIQSCDKSNETIIPKHDLPPPNSNFGSRDFAACNVPLLILAFPALGLKLGYFDRILDLERDYGKVRHERRYFEPRIAG